MKVHGARSVFALAVAFSFLLAPALVAAQYYGSNQAVDYIWVKTFGFEKSWLSTPNLLITQAILPTIAIYAIFLGLLRTLQIFRGMGSMEHVISIVVCLTMLFTGGIGWIAGVLGFLGVWSIAIFVILMVLGGILYSIGFMRKKGQYLRDVRDAHEITENHIRNRLKAVMKAEHDYASQQQAIGDVMDEKSIKLGKKINDCKTDRKQLIEEWRQVNEAFELADTVDEVKIPKKDKADKAYSKY